MVIVVAVWMLIWGGMFSGVYNLAMPKFTSSPFAFFQGVRALFPMLAIYLCFLWVMSRRSKFPLVKDPLGYFFIYGVMGFIGSMFLTVNTVDSLYWAGAYLSPFFGIWLALASENPKEKLQKIILVNYVVFFFFALNIFPEAVRIFRGKTSLSAFFSLPFGLGDFTRNGAGRFALVMAIVSFCRFIVSKSKYRYLWFAFFGPGLFILMMTQSRTALLGLAVVSVLFIFLRGIDWRYLFLGPVAAYVVWMSGFKWRAKGQIEQLISLTGREVTWQKGIALIKNSPFLGWGFNADRLMLNYEHMHNSYLHAMIQTGILGFIFFVAALFSIWNLIGRARLFDRIKSLGGSNYAFLMESIMIIGFMTIRSFFESTAAFFGVDLLILVPAMAYVSLVAQEGEEGVPEFELNAAETA